MCGEGRPCHCIVSFCADLGQLQNLGAACGSLPMASQHLPQEGVVVAEAFGSVRIPAK